MMTYSAATLLYLLLGYFCGSIPFGLILTRLAGMGDIRNVGSGNIGATNVLRTGNKTIAALTLLCDALKGLIPVLAARPAPELMILAAVGALAGHLFPVWLKFNGGKGVATLIGITFGFSWVLGLIFVALWLAIAILSKISSLSALIASAALPFFALFLGHESFVLPLGAFAVIIWYKHKANISRLVKGEEPKISFSKSA
jgi:acyl phosphate:glycerol-3-phosphate acyltransferase